MNKTINALKTTDQILEFYPVLTQLFDYVIKESIQESFSDLLSKGIKFVGLYVDDKPIGFMQYQVANNLENYKYLVLDELVIDSEYRGQGFGTKLLEYLENQAKVLNLSGIRLLSGVKREKAHEFYIKNGYEFKSKWFAKKIAKPDSNT